MAKAKYIQVTGKQYDEYKLLKQTFGHLLHKDREALHPLTLNAAQGRYYVPIHKPTLKHLREHKDSAKLIALYTFYCETAHTQGQIYGHSYIDPLATDEWVAEQLGMALGTLKKYKAQLQAIGVIDVKPDRKQGRFKYYVKIKQYTYIRKKRRKVKK